MMQQLQCQLMTREQQRCFTESIKEQGLYRSKWDGTIDKHKFIAKMREIPADEFLAWSIFHLVENMIPCNSCRNKRLTRGLHQAVSYNIKTDLNEIPAQEDKHLKTLKHLTDLAYARATFEGRLELV